MRSFFASGSNWSASIYGSRSSGGQRQSPVNIGAGTGRAGGAVAPPTKLLGEQVIHPAPPIFLAVPQFDVSFPEKLLKIVATVLPEARFLS